LLTAILLCAAPSFAPAQEMVWQPSTPAGGAYASAEYRLNLAAIQRIGIERFFGTGNGNGGGTVVYSSTTNFGAGSSNTTVNVDADLGDGSTFSFTSVTDQSQSTTTIFEPGSTQATTNVDVGANL